MVEMWLTIEGLDGLYAFSNYGRIYDYNKQEYSVGYLNKKTGYYEKLLFKDGKYYKGGGIHKFIYEAFKGKIPKGMEINHIDFDKSNNAIWNLNLLSHEDNMNWGLKTVYQYSKNGDFIAQYNSIKDAAEKNGFDRNALNLCLRKKQYTAFNYIWTYKKNDELVNEIINKIKTKDCFHKVIQYTKDGQLVKEYPSVLEASRCTGIVRQTIIKNCKGKIKNPHKWIWKYKEVA